jgi:hypothetical protein
VHLHKEGHVEHIGFRRVNEVGLGLAQLRRDEVVRLLDECFFSPTPDYPKVGGLCQRILCAVPRSWCGCTRGS